MLSAKKCREFASDNSSHSDEVLELVRVEIYALANVVVDSFKASPKSVRDTVQPHGVKLFEKNAAPPLESGVPAVSSATSPPEPAHHPSAADEPTNNVPVSQRCEGVPTHGDVEKWVAEENQRGLCGGESNKSHRPNATSNPE